MTSQNFIRAFFCILCLAIIPGSSVNGADMGFYDTKSSGPNIITEKKAGRALFKNHRLTLEAINTPLLQILEIIKKQCKVKVIGLENRFNEKITFIAGNEPVEKALKRLLRDMGEENYAFLYSKTRLRRVMIFPGSKSEFPRTPEPAGSKVQKQNPLVVKAVKIIRINKGTQAENLDLQKNDFVVEYDGVKITNSKQLVELVNRKSPDDVVEMVVVRDKVPFRIVLNGGLIGINIRTVHVKRSVLGR